MLSGLLGRAAPAAPSSRNVQIAPQTPRAPLRASGQIHAQPTTSASTAKDKLAMLDKAKEKRLEALTQDGYNPYKTGAPGIVDVRLYHAAVESQKRMSTKLSEANAQMTLMERRMEETTKDLQDAAAFLKKVAMEFGTTSRLVESTAAAVRFGVDKEDAVAKLVKLCERLEALEKTVQVKLMGDFDSWTRGFELSAANIDSDGVIKTFEAEVPLLPGRYRAKFLVDGGWRLASDWPTENDELGETNNILIVQPMPL